MKSRLRQLLGYLLIAAALGAGAEYFMLVDHYARILPRSPQPQSGQIIPLDDHGTRVFLNDSQQHTLWALQLGAVVTGALGGLLVVYRRGKSN